jgi:hypothetical protein
MPRRKPATPPISPSERDLHAAIDRLLANDPRNKDLVRVVREKSIVPINKLNVAKEAERSRTTLDKYPAVVARIEALSKLPATSTRDALEQLRTDKHRLDAERREAIDVSVAMLVKMRKLEDDAARAVAEAQRVAKRPDANRVVGNENILPFKGSPNDA